MGDAQRRAPGPILDMTPEGGFREPPPPSRWERALARLGGVAILVALAAGGLLLVALAVVFIGLLLPVMIVAGAIGAGSLWWRLRRLRRNGGNRDGSIRLVTIRR